MSVSSTLIASMAGIALAGGMYFYGHHVGYDSGYTKAENTYAVETSRQLSTAIEQERKKQEALDVERIKANKSAHDWRSKYERLLKLRPSTPADLQTCIRERNELRRVAERCHNVIGRAREGLDRYRIEWK